MKTILVLDECCGPSVYKPVTYSGFLSPDELKGEIRLIIITSLNGLSLEDKERCLDYKEIELPTANGMLECHALRFHKLYGIDVVYTKQEDLILRAAHIRRLLGLKEGMLPDLALLYRDKERMKTRLQSNGFPVPNFNRVHSPVDILSFAETHGFPVIVKPTLGQASAGIRLIHDNADLEKYLESEFYERLSDRMMDYSGDMLIEQFVPGKMFHVNGYAKNGKIEIVWPFAYVSTNLDFTKGKAYGNVLIAQSDELFKPLVEATQRVINILGAPEHLIFHAEVC